MIKRLMMSLIILSMLISVLGCASGEESLAVSTEVSTTESNQVKDVLENYKETPNVNKVLGPDKSYEITGEIKEETHDNPDSNTYTDGSFLLYESITDGTPYDFGGVIYNEELFDIKEYEKYSPGAEGEVGGGEGCNIYRMIPKQSGEADLVILTRYIVDDIYEGTLYHVNVDDNMKCTILWSADVKEGDNIKIVNN